MDFRILVLYYLISVAGFVMVAGGMLLIYKQKIYIDRETNQIIEVEVPPFGRFRTNIPALALFVIGFAPMVYAVQATKIGFSNVNISGTVTSQPFDAIEIYGVVEKDVARIDEPAGKQYVLNLPWRADGNGCLELHYMIDDALAKTLRVPTEAARNGRVVMPPLDLQPKKLDRITYRVSPTPVPNDYQRDP